MIGNDAHTEFKERHSIPIPKEELTPLSDREKAEQEARNTIHQYDRMEELILESLKQQNNSILRPSVIQELNGISLDQIESDAGRWRTTDVRINHSDHIPPSPKEIPTLIDEMCAYVNKNGNTAHAFHLAAYVMWRLNWIHPFVNGNGRTTRAVAYYVLSAGLKSFLPGELSIPEQIAQDKKEYYDALEAADKTWANGNLDVSNMEELLRTLCTKQLQSALELESENEPKDEPHKADSERSSRLRTTVRNGLGQPRTLRVACGFSVFLVLSLVGLIILGILGYSVPEDTKWVVVLLYAFCVGAASSLFVGYAAVTGRFGENSQQQVLEYTAGGGVAVFIITLFVCVYLFIK